MNYLAYITWLDDHVAQSKDQCVSVFAVWDGAEQRKHSGKSASCEAWEWEVIQSISEGDRAHQCLCCSASPEAGSAQTRHCPSSAEGAARPDWIPCAGDDETPFEILWSQSYPRPHCL